MALLKDTKPTKTKSRRGSKKTRSSPASSVLSPEASDAIASLQAQIRELETDKGKSAADLQEVKDLRAEVARLKQSALDPVAARTVTPEAAARTTSSPFFF